MVGAVDYEQRYSVPTSSSGNSSRNPASATGNRSAPHPLPRGAGPVFQDYYEQGNPQQGRSDQAFPQQLFAPPPPVANDTSGLLNPPSVYSAQRPYQPPPQRVNSASFGPPCPAQQSYPPSSAGGSVSSADRHHSRHQLFGTAQGAPAGGPSAEDRFFAMLSQETEQQHQLAQHVADMSYLQREAFPADSARGAPWATAAAMGENSGRNVAHQTTQQHLQAQVRAHPQDLLDPRLASGVGTRRGPTARARVPNFTGPNFTGPAAMVGSRKPGDHFQPRGRGVVAKSKGREVENMASILAEGGSGTKMLSQIKFAAEQRRRMQEVAFLKAS